MLGMPSKYTYPRNLVVTIHINGISLPNTLINLGAEINVIDVDITQKLQIEGLRPTQTLLELADKSILKP